MAGAEVGAILVQVQEDLQHLKRKLQDISQDWEAVDVGSLKDAIERTESGLRKHAEKYLNTIHTSVLTISPSDSVCSRKISKRGIPPEAPKKQIVFSPTAAVSARPGSLSPLVSSGSKHKLAMTLKVLYNPRNARHRDILHQNYEVSMPLINKRKTAPLPLPKIAKGITVGKLPVAPPSFSLGTSRSVLPLTSVDTRKGILNLVERGLIPRAARITLEKPLFQLVRAPLHEPHSRHRKPATDRGAESKKAAEGATHSHPSKGSRGTVGSIAPPPSCMSMVSHKKSKQPKTPTGTPDRTLKKPALEFDILISKGKIEHNSDLLGFKQHCCLFWGSALSFLEQVASLLKDYAVPSAVISGKKVMSLLPDFEFHQRPTREELLSVIKNSVRVRRLLKRPGQRYKGQNGTEMAATKIQATWRCYRLRKAYIHFWQRQWASGVIAISWRVHVHRSRVRNILQESRQKHLENFCTRAKHLAANWNRIRTSKRTVIHIPSLGHAQQIREATPDFAIQQSLQVGRLCEIRDSNVNVIYICPIQLSKELLQYYDRLLGLQAAVRTGDPKDIADLQDRFKILTPEAINSFPGRPLPLASLLKYSPKTIKRIRNLIQGKEAYIVGGLPHQDDLEVADMLDVPILGPDPEVAHLYSSKSGSKRVFAAACVPVPPGKHDIYSRQQMVEVLSQLILDYPEVKRWIFKVDNDFGGNGTAYCDVITHLKCYLWVQKERQKYGPEIWHNRWAHEPALAKISQELPGLLAQHAQAVNEKRFPTWGKFFQTFVSQGGIIEAFPPSDNITNLTVDMLIEPTGEITVVSSGDQIHADGPFRSSGSTLPQASVEPKLLNSLCLKIGEACKARGVIGYFSIDFATFIDPQTMAQQVWAVDLDLRYSDHLAMTQVLLYVTNGKLDSQLSRFEVQLVPRKPKCWQAQNEQPKTASVVSRYVVMTSSMVHSSLSFIYYNVFLDMCKAHGIGYDIQQKEGTIFTIFEDQKRHRFGMLTIGEHLQGVLMTFARHLFIIYQELSAPNMHAETNFKVLVRDIETILGVADHNRLQFEEKQPASKELAPVK